MQPEAGRIVDPAPSVSVIMANFNGSAYLAEAIASVQNQTLRSIELIISDDASTDDSIRIVGKAIASDPRISLIEAGKNAGPGAARNRALEVARGRWVAVIDSDDIIHPERLARLVEAAERDGADIVADDLEEFESGRSEPSGRLLSGVWTQAPTWVTIRDYIRLNHFYGSGPALGYLKPIFRASVFADRSVRYDETLRVAEDYDLVLRLLHKGYTLRVYPWLLYHYRRHQNSISHRLNESVLAALVAADRRFLDAIAPAEPRLVASVKARTRSTEAAIAYERLLNALKARDIVAALRISAGDPRAALLLRLPIGVRLRRLFRLDGRQRPAADTKIKSAGSRPRGSAREAAEPISPVASSDS